MFEGMDKREEWEKNMDAELEEKNALVADKEALAKENSEKDKLIAELMEGDENRKKLKDELDEKGFDLLPVQTMLNDVVLFKKTPAEMLMANGFNRTQAYDIMKGVRTVGDYEYSKKNDNGVPVKWTIKK